MTTYSELVIMTVMDDEEPRTNMVVLQLNLRWIAFTNKCTSIFISRIFGTLGSLHVESGRDNVNSNWLSEVVNHAPALALR